ncbi:MAG: hypothetical protein RLZZ210_1146 [Pseudomonadota bacterium]|jgi:PTS system nitrogen regulatory IIA component
MDFLSLISNRIYLNVPAKNSEELFISIADIMSNPQISSAEIYSHLKIREELGSTGLGLGVAIPHSRIKNLHQTIISIVRISQAIEFKAPDNENVNIFIAILVPEQATQEHLDLLSYIANMLADDELREILNSSNNTEDILQAIQIYHHQITEQ